MPDDAATDTDHALSARVRRWLARLLQLAGVVLGGLAAWLLRGSRALDAPLALADGRAASPLDARPSRLSGAPPAHWLEHVRSRAPQLLLEPDAGATARLPQTLRGPAHPDPTPDPVPGSSPVPTPGAVEPQLGSHAVPPLDPAVPGAARALPPHPVGRRRDGFAELLQPASEGAAPAGRSTAGAAAPEVAPPEPTPPEAALAGRSAARRAAVAPRWVGADVEAAAPFRTDSRSGSAPVRRRSRAAAPPWPLLPAAAPSAGPPPERALRGGAFPADQGPDRFGSDPWPRLPARAGDEAAHDLAAALARAAREQRARRALDDEQEGCWWSGSYS